MSGIAGIFNIDGQPVDRQLLERMSGLIAHRGPDRSGFWVARSIGMAHRMLCTTPESLHETQPLRNERGNLCLVLDGRIDNRDELIPDLLAKGLVLRDDTDAECVLRAYECWGEDCPNRLIGDFAFAIWDADTRRMFCARDILGIKPFYYYLTHTVFAWSSELRPLLIHPALQLKPNDGMIGEYLTSFIVNRQETLYEGIYRLPPASTLTVQHGTVRISRYFDLDASKEIRYKTDADYAEHFYQLFHTAIRCRLRSHLPATIFLSGGLDSSSIVGMTQQLVRAGQCPAPQVSSCSLAFSHPEADERTYMDDVTSMWEMPHQTVIPDQWVAPPLTEQVRQYRDMPDFPNASPCRRLCAIVRERGGCVSLWGFGGDEWFTGDSTHCADLLRQLRLSALVQQIRFDYSTSNLWGKQQVGGLDIIRWCLYPLIPRPVKKTVKRLLQRDVPSWMDPGFARRIDLQERLLCTPEPPRQATEPQRSMYALFHSGRAATEYDLTDRLQAYEGAEGRYPFNDRRLIEFAFAIPEDQRWRGNQTKFVLRQAAHHLLPEPVRSRRTKADFSFLYTKTFERECTDELFGSLQLARDGYVDAARTKALYQRCRGGDIWSEESIWMILAIERWYVQCFLPDNPPITRRPHHGRPS